MVAVDQHINHLKYFMPRQRISPQLPDRKKALFLAEVHN